MPDFAEKLFAMNQECGWNFKLSICGDRIDLASYGIEHNRCVDDKLISCIALIDKDLMKYPGLRSDLGQLNEIFSGKMLRLREHGDYKILK